MLVSGLELFYREKLEAIINHQTSNYEFDLLVKNRDFNQLIDIIELIMGMVVNCEEKANYIEKILDLDEKTQDDLKKLIERSLQRLQLELGEMSMGASEAPSHIVAMEKNIESLEKEKMSLREKVGELESDNKQLILKLKEKDEYISRLQSTIEVMQ
jgi:chromosome segregation ATPase